MLDPSYEEMKAFLKARGFGEYVVEVAIYWFSHDHFADGGENLKKAYVRAQHTPDLEKLDVDYNSEDDQPCEAAVAYGALCEMVSAPPTIQAERRRALVAALRAPMPPGVTWDYTVTLQKTSCGTRGCALAVAMKLWPETFHDRVPFVEDIRRFFGLTERSTIDVFFGDYGTPGLCVTPQMVADRLETVGV